MDARELKDKATQLFSKGKFAKAAEAYEEFCAADAKDHQARLRCGDAWNKAGKKDKAASAYTAAAEGFARDGFLPRAIAASKLVLEIDPNHKAVQKMLADLYSQKRGPAPVRGSSASALRPAPTQEVTRGVQSPGTAAAFSKRHDAIDLDAPAPRSAPASHAAPPPPPGMRADAIELPSYELPLEESDASAPETGHRRKVDVAAIEIELEPAGASGAPAALVETAIEIELGGQPVTGEVEIPIEGQSIPDADQLPHELQIVQGTSTSTLTAPIDPFAPPAPSAPVYDLSDEADAPAPAPAPTSGVYELTEALPDARSPEVVVPHVAAASPQRPDAQPTSGVYDLSDEVPEAPVPAAAQAEPAPVSSLPPAIADAPRPPGIAPVTGADAGPPPGLKPRRAADAAEAPSASSRIWLPPAFAAPSPPAASAQPPPPELSQRQAPDEPDVVTDLERGLQAFLEFDPDAAPSPASSAAPVAPPAALASAGFTELDLEGDSLLRAVEAAAAAAAPAADPSAPVEALEEAMEAPDDARPEPGALPKIPLFSDLPEEAFIALFEQCPLQRFDQGQLVFEQGDKADAFYVICAGSTRVFRVEGGKRFDLASLEEGSFFGELALLSDAPRSASVEAAEEDTQVLVISAEVLRELSVAHPAVASALKKFSRQRMLTNLMNNAPLFAPFSRGDRRDLVQKFRAREVPRGEVLVHEGKGSDGLYVVLYGEVEVVAKGRTLATLREGQVFGEMSLLQRTPATASVRATRHTSLLRLPKPDFDGLILSHPQVLEHVAELVDERQKANAAAGML